MTTQVFWLLCFAIRSSSGSLPYAEKAAQALSKDAFSSAAGTARGTGSAREDGRERRLPPPEMPSPPRDKKKRTKASLENSTGLSKHLWQPLESPAEGPLPRSPEPSQANRGHTDRRRAGSANSVSLRSHHAAAPQPWGPSPLGAHPCPASVGSEDPNSLHHLNPPKPAQPLAGTPSPSWVTNRWSRRAPDALALLGTGGAEDKECVSECRGERDEVEAFCASEFAVNGIVYDMESLGRGVHWITLLVTSEGLYKMSRLYVIPDAAFFRVHILVVDTLNCRKPCPDFKLGSRYIVMGRIFQRRREVRAELPPALRGRLRPGDGCIGSTSGFVRRFNRRRDHKVRAARAKCP